MTWQKAISFENGEWKAKTVEECGLPVTISLADGKFSVTDVYALDQNTKCSNIASFF